MDREGRIANLGRILADLQGQAIAQESTAKRLEHDIALRQIAAPTSGYLGRVEQLRVGSVVHTGDVLGTVVPVGKPHAVAFFPVSRAGKIRPGQRSQLRLDAFPWTQYGALQATVVSVGNDPLDSRVRVELSLHAESTPTIPLAHGLSGTAEVEVEQASPAELLIRALGRKLTTTSAGRMAATVPATVHE
jgi:membrane fusion protein (multidrug efflux system)